MLIFSLALLLFLGRAHAPAALPVQVIRLDGKPSALVTKGDSLFVASFENTNLAVYDTGTRRQTNKVYLDAYETAAPVIEDGREVGKKHGLYRCPPGDMVAAGGKLFVGQLFSEHVVVFDAATMWVVKRLPLGGSGNFVASADGKTVYYASNERNEFHVIDADTYEYQTVAYPAGGRGVGAMALSPDGGRLYLGVQRGGKAPDGKEHPGGNAFLAVYGLVRQRYVGTVYLAEINATGDSDDAIPASILPSPDGRLVYVGMFQSAAGVRVIDAAKLKMLPGVSFRPDRQDPGPSALAYFKGRLLSVSRGDNALTVLDPVSLKALARLSPSDDGARFSRVFVEGKRIYLADEATRRVYILSGRKLARLLAQAKADVSGEKPVEATLRPEQRK